MEVCEAQQSGNYDMLITIHFNNCKNKEEKKPG